MKAAVFTGVAMFGGSFATYALKTGASDLLPKWLSAIMGLVLYAAGLLLFVLSLAVAYRNKDGRVAFVAFLGLAIGGAMAGVVEKEPGSFYGVSVGVFASLILALAATGTGRRRTGAWP
jgi:hypothetical protein